jgi:hypothetical protein
VSEQLIGVWVIVCDELHTGIHEGGDKREIAGEAVKLGNDPWLFLAEPAVFWWTCETHKERHSKDGRLLHRASMG